MVSSEGNKVDPKKIEAVRNWPRPTSAIKIRSSLGLVGYYRRFVEEFSTISAPLPKLTQKGALLKWSNKCKDSFSMLKTTLTAAPILVLPTGSASYTMYIDASHIGLGALLIQDGGVVAYASRQLKVHEKNTMCMIWI
ncbi:uncharacterized mitochondrial protein AtMg00860-like [Nicotiana tomentosiformis]|uniref:uncharacterized mitochondrial protein AtMg00860-like n=1 Tax=Nicotiana tomentosiformis TaxID=4098 RepID=UPI00388CDBCE